MSHRTQITLTDAQYARLRQESERTGLGLATLVRRALDAFFPEGRQGDPAQILEASFGAWKDRDFDGEEYVERLRPGMAQRLSL
jgi:hypothetical protein